MRKQIAVTAAVGIVAALVSSVPAAGAPSAAEPDTEYGRMMLVLDSSGSMKEPAGGGQSKIQAAKSALSTVIDDLPDEADVGLRVFGAEVFSRNDPGACEDTQQVVEPGTGNRDALRSAVKGYEPYGETPIPAALRGAADDIGREGRRSIVLVSDGESTCGDPCSVAKNVASRGVDLQIDVVGLSVSGQARRQLQCIADKGNGRYYDADDAEDISDSLTDASERATRPFEFTGTPVEGTPTADDAPMVTTGQYLDTIQTRGDRHYRFQRTAPGSTVHFGLIFEGEHDDLVSNLSPEISVVDEDGELSQCRHTVVQSVTHGDSNQLIFGATHSQDTDPEEPCNTADELVLGTTSGDDTGALAGKPVQLMVYEEPAVSPDALDALPPQPDPPQWSDLTPGTADAAVDPGTSIANAPIVTDGTYSFDINPGENQVIGIPVDWGQHVQAQFDARMTDEIRSQWGVGAGVALDVIGPLAGDATAELDAPEDWCDTGVLQGCPDEWRSGTLSHTVAYRNRFDSSDNTASAGLPGVHYIQVRYQLDKDINVPYELTLKTVGEAGGGEPEYDEVDGLEPPVADSRLVVAGDADGDGAGDDGAGKDAAREADTEAAGGEDDESGGSLALVAGVSAGGLGVVALLGAGVLLLRRRRS